VFTDASSSGTPPPGTNGGSNTGGALADDEPMRCEGGDSRCHAARCREGRFLDRDKFGPVTRNANYLDAPKLRAGFGKARLLGKRGPCQQYQKTKKENFPAGICFHKSSD